MLKSRVIFLAILTLVVFSMQLFAKEDSRWLIPRSIVASTDLKIIWQYNVPMADGESLEKLYLFENRLCVLSSRNYLTCLNRTDGNVVFSNIIAPTGLPVAGFKSYKGELLTIVGDKIIVVGADSGIEKTSIKITSGATCPVVRNDSFFYVAGIDKRLHVLKTDNKVQAFEVAAENDSLITSVLAERDFVVFATNAGNVISISANKSVKRWQFDAPEAVIGDIVHDANSLYFACRDTSIYRLDLYTGHVLWKYQIQAIPQTTPQPGSKVVYQYLPDIGLIALDKETAKFLWQAPGGIGLLAETGDKAFIINNAGLLTAMDNVKAKKLYSIDIGQAVRFVTNTNDSMIYVADAKGRLTCLAPAQ
jgi:outer membrane protein assembly factor BamB